MTNTQDDRVHLMGLITNARKFWDDKGEPYPDHLLIAIEQTKADEKKVDKRKGPLNTWTIGIEKDGY